MSVTANLTTNVETITATIVVEDETITAEINTAARGPAGAAGSNAITSATTSDGTADLSLSNVTTATATVSGTLTADHIHGNLAGNVYGHIRAGETLAKGDPVYVSGSHGSGSTLIPIVSKADASNAAKMPAIGIMDAGVTIHNNGHMVIVGTITELNTAAYTVNAELYVAAGGTLTATPPTARAQPVARVERANANNGAIIVKVNGLSASDATASTLVRRDGTGGANFAGTVNLAIGVISDLRFEDYQAAVGATFIYNGTSASDHRIALGAGTTGATLFGAATAAAARTTLGLATTDSPTFAGATISGPALVSGPNYPVLDVLRTTAATADFRAAARFRRSNSSGTSSSGIGVGCFFENPNSANTLKFSGFFGGGLSTVTASSEVGELVFSPAWQGNDPSSRRDMVLRATGAATSDLSLAGNLTASGTVAVTGATTLTGAVTTANFIAGVEMTAPAAPAANGYRIYAEDNGAGKTRLMVLFATGAAQQIAIEP